MKLSSAPWLAFFLQAEDGIRDRTVTGVQTCALPIWLPSDPDAWSAQAYDCVYLLKIAMEGGGFTRAAIREELEKIGSIQPAYDGVTGKHVFDKNGDMDKPLL